MTKQDLLNFSVKKTEPNTCAEKLLSIIHAFEPDWVAEIKEDYEDNVVFGVEEENLSLLDSQLAALESVILAVNEDLFGEHFPMLYVEEYHETEWQIHEDKDYSPDEED